MKKWTYLVASVSAALCFGSVVTSCVDNDEPFGIQEVRKAYAELLSSKAVLADAQAQAALAQAEAEKIKAQAEATKAEVEKIKAEAQAEIDKAASEAETAAIKAYYEALIAQVQQETQNSIVEAEQKLAILKLKYEKLLIAYEQDKLDLSESQLSFVDSYYAAYLNALLLFNQANEEYIRAQQELLKDQIDLEGKQLQKQQQYENAVAEAEKALEKVEKTLADYQGYLEEVKALPSEGYVAKIEELQEQYNDFTTQLNELNVQFEARKLDNKETYDAVPAAQAAYQAVRAEAVAIDEYKSHDYENDGVNSLYEGNKIIVAAGEYSLNDPSNYDQAIYNLCTYLIGDVYYPSTPYEAYNMWQAGTLVPHGGIVAKQLDDNAQAWTNASINEYKRLKSEAEDNFGQDYDVWNAAVLAYNEGDAPDYQKLYGTQAITDAVAAYNASIDPLNAAAAAWVEAKTAYNNALTDLGVSQSVIDNIQNVYESAVDAANSILNAAVSDAKATLDAAVVSAQKAESKAAAAVTEAEAVLKAKTALYEASKTDENKAAVEAATADLKTANDALTAAKEATPKTVAAATETYNIAVAEATADQAISVAAAQRVYDEAMVDAAEDKAAVDAFNTASDNLAAAKDVFEAAKNEAQMHANGVNKAAADQWSANRLGSTSVSYPWYHLWWDVENAYNDLVQWGLPLPEDGKLLSEVEVEDYYLDIPDAEYKQIVLENSWQVYGDSSNYSDDILADDVYGDYVCAGQLIPMTYKQANDMIAVKLGEIQNPEKWYYLFGDQGAVWTLQYKIDLGQAYLDNVQALTDEVNRAKDTIDALVAANQAQQDKADEAYADIYEAEAKVTALEQDIKDQMDEIYRQQGVVMDVINALKDGIGYYYFDDYYDETGKTVKPGVVNIQATIKELESKIETYESQVKTCEDQLALRQHKLDAFQKQQTDVESPAQLNVDAAEAALALAQARLDAAKEQLDRAIAAIEGSEE